MKNLLHPADREALIHRLQGLRPDSQRRWGQLDARQLLPHLTDPLLVALGDRTAQPMPSVLSKRPLSTFMVWLAPWPKGAPTAAEFIPGKKGTPPLDFDRDRQALLLAIHRFAQQSENQSFHPSPVFGRLSNRAWGRLMWRHINHHLRQFGL
ncbi:MAG: DUF1569 domain-containing protein [Saprospiraceae bacterium]|nr:DUF1569 domain-containing protein [Saprospiraceae bacterium]